MRWLRTYVALGLAATALSTAACAPKAVRGEQVEGLDDEAMSTGLDKYDLQKMLHENMEELQASAVIKRWEGENMPKLAVIPLRNETTEHVDSALEALSSKIETTLVKAGHVTVINLAAQPALVEQVRQAQGDAFNPAQATEWGRQLSAQYIITGRVYSTDERQKKERRVQYFMFLQVLEVETSAILFQNETSVTKAII
jgi:uncharacterized protein (TIGR02722 family)